MSNRLAKKIVICLTVVIALLFLYQCPMRIFLGIECPGCGMTRAYMALLQLDFEGAFNYHQLFPIPAIVAIYMLFRRWFNIGEKWETVIGSAFIAAFFIRWILVIFL